MKKIILILMAGLASIALSGCAGSSYSMAKNGQYYSNAQAKQCVNYKLYKDNSIDCRDKNGQYLGKMYPVHPNVIREDRYQREKFSQSMSDLGNSMQYSARTTSINNLAMGNYIDHNYGY